MLHMPPTLCDVLPEQLEAADSATSEMEDPNQASLRSQGYAGETEPDSLSQSLREGLPRGTSSSAGQQPDTVAAVSDGSG